MNYFMNYHINGSNSGAQSTQIAIMTIIIIVIVIIILLILRLVYLSYIKKHTKQIIAEDIKLFTKCRKNGKYIRDSNNTYYEYLDILKLNKVINCSSSVVKNASIDPVRYTIKYSNINCDYLDIEQLEFIKDYLNKLDMLISDMEEAKQVLRKKLPLYFKPLVRKKDPYIICNLKYKIVKINRPYLLFSYTSPAGKTSRNYKARINQREISAIVSIISGKISKKGHSKIQRQAMSNDLREAIKKRDNYTCQKCGNSIFNEPNLLLEVDHIIPISKGGKTEASNLQTLCWRCNREKSNK